MARADLGVMLEAAEKSGFIGGGYLKLKEGENRMRLIDGPLPHPGAYQGRKTFRWLWYVIDRRDGEIKPFFMPHSVYKLLTALQRSEDFGFESIPMPFDVVIGAKGAGTKEVEYSLLPTKKNPGDAELIGLADKKPLKELQGALREKEATHVIGDPTVEAPRFDPDDDIPL